MASVSLRGSQMLRPTLLCSLILHGACLAALVLYGPIWPEEQNEVVLRIRPQQASSPGAAEPEPPVPVQIDPAPPPPMPQEDPPLLEPPDPEALEEPLPWDSILREPPRVPWKPATWTAQSSSHELSHLKPEPEDQAPEDTDPERTDDAPETEAQKPPQAPGSVQAAHVPAAPLADDNEAPRYPERARRLGLQGSVWLNVTVAPDGSVANVAVAEPVCPHRILVRAAITAVKTWRYRPARESGQATVSVRREQIIFRLNDR